MPELGAERWPTMGEFRCRVGACGPAEDLRLSRPIAMIVDEHLDHELGRADERAGLLPRAELIPLALRLFDDFADAEHGIAFAVLSEADQDKLQVRVERGEQDALDRFDCAVWFTDDLRQDELPMLGRLDREDRRWLAGGEQLEIGHRRDRRRVGGGTIHFGDVALCLWPQDFRRRTLEGIGQDWSIGCAEVGPLYDQIEQQLAWSRSEKPRAPRAVHELRLLRVEGRRRVYVLSAFLPSPDNRGELSGELDEYGVPRPLVTFSHGDNEHAMREEKHRLGTAPSTSVDDPDLQHAGHRFDRNHTRDGPPGRDDVIRLTN